MLTEACQLNARLFHPVMKPASGTLLNCAWPNAELFNGPQRSTVVVWFPKFVRSQSGKKLPFLSVQERVVLRTMAEGGPKRVA